MYVINLLDPKQGNISYKVAVTPTGEFCICFDQSLPTESNILVVSSAASPVQLFLLQQVAEYLNNKDIAWQLYLVYIGGHQTSRRMSELHADYGKIIIEQLQALNPWGYKVLEPWSRRVLTLKDRFGNGPVYITGLDLLSGSHPQYDIICDYMEDAINLQVKEDGEIIVLNPDKFSKNEDGSDKDCLLLMSETVTSERIKAIKKAIGNRQLDLLVTHIVNDNTVKRLASDCRTLYTSDAISHEIKPDVTNLVLLPVFTLNDESVKTNAKGKA